MLWAGRFPVTWDGVGNIVYKRFVKRGMDIVLSLAGIIVLAVPMMVVAAITKLDSAGPVLFQQTRVGRNKTHFCILKFRSMPVSAPRDVPTHQLQGKHTLSGWQRLIRRTSIDELPQLFNVLKGDMSIVGPRPALWNQYDLIAERELYGANSLRPGMTGWAQVNGRDRLTVSEKARLDGAYARQVSLRFDCRCFFLTVVRVLQCDGVAECGAGKKTGELSAMGEGVKK